MQSVRVILLSWMLFAGTLAAQRQMTATPQSIGYRLLESSEVVVNGKSNINHFACIAGADSNPKEAIVSCSSDLGTLVFTRTKIHLAVGEMDCGVKAITRDFRKTVRAEEFPHIDIELLSATNTLCAIEGCDYWALYEASVQITIAGICQSVEIPVIVRQLDDGSIKCEGRVLLKLSDFQLEAPRALIGLIKVEDRLDVDIQLLVRLSNQSTNP